MPSLDHVTMKDYHDVYEPSDDTYLLLDGILLGFQSNENINNHSDSFTALEIGCGTGIPIVYLGLQQQTQQQQQRFQQQHGGGGGSACDVMTLLATDCNPHALRVAQATATVHGLDLTTHQCDLASALLSSSSSSLPGDLSTDVEIEEEGCYWDGSIDMLLFNPPYVPTPDEEVVDFNGNGNTSTKCDGSFENRVVGIEASWAGGLHGRRVIDRAIPQIARLLRKTTGVAYMITVDDNLPEQLGHELENLGLRMEPWVRRRARNEYLTVQRITWI